MDNDERGALVAVYLLVVVLAVCVWIVDVRSNNRLDKLEERIEQFEKSVDFADRARGQTTESGGEA